MLDSYFSLSHFSPLHSHFSLSRRHSLLPTHHHPETFLVDAGDEIVEALEDPAGCGLCCRGFVGCAMAKDELVEALAFLANAGLWVVPHGFVIFLSTLTNLPWVCDL